jgi:hypothetical protein
LKNLLRLTALVSAMVLSHSTSAATAVSLKSSNLVLQQGNGWALVKPNVDAYQSMLQQQGQAGSAEYAEAELYRDANLMAITTVQGLVSSGLPLGYIQKKLTEYGYSYPVSSSYYSQGIGPIVIDPDRVEEAFNGSSKTASLASFSCGDKHGSKSFSMAVGNKNISQSYSVGSYATVNADIGFGATGTAEVEVFYKKDRSWGSLCQTYDVDYKYHEITANMNFVDTSIALSGTANYEYNAKLFEDQYEFFKTGGDFWVWIVQFDWSLEVGAKLDVDLTAKASATIAYEGKVNGNMDIHWKCVNSDCTPMKNDVINIDYTPNEQLLYSLEVDVEIDPKVTLYVNADLDIYWGILDLVEAEAGIVLGAPLRFYGYYGNACSDGDGDGSNETVQGALVDWNAELYAYWHVGLFNSTGHTRQISFDIFGWKDAYSTDTMFDSNIPILTKHIWFQDLLNPISTILTPVIGGTSVVTPTGALFNIKPRSCYPFGENVKLEVNWGDGQIQTLNTSTAGQVVSHNWSTLGNKQVSVTLVDDVHGRDFGSDYTTNRTIQVTTDGKPQNVATLTAATQAATTSQQAGINFNWTHPSTGAAHHFAISKTYDPVVGSTTTTQLYNLSGIYTSRFYSFSGTTSGDVITFNIQACDSSNNCSAVRSLPHTVNNSTAIPNPVAGMWAFAEADHLGKIYGTYINWSGPPTGIPDHYKLQVSYTSFFGDDVVKAPHNVGGTNEEYWVSTSGISKGQTVTVKVQACNSNDQCSAVRSLSYSNGYAVNSGNSPM